ncbi:MAG: penicillin-binding transpeptidase domain-containing protein, partial [Dongiaceae bacterium]
VRAYIGSGDYFDERRYGQNDMVTAVRSPGSTLKPFVYGLAFDELLLHPETIVVDRPMRFADFAPENFDHFYRGEVSAREALQLSLNLPAVAVLSRLGPQRLFDGLQAAGTPLRLPQDVSKPGLPIALGGAGTTLQDLVTLYAGIASSGRVLPLKFTDTDPQTEAVALMSETAAWYLGRILEDSPPPPNAIASRNRDRVVPIAFKTGTSYGYRDAWSIGFNNYYTVGVWVGRPDGSFSPGRMGREVAAPIMFEVFDMLPTASAVRSVQRAPPPPRDAITATNIDLPLALRRFEVESPGLTELSSAKDRPRIEFPSDGVTLDVARNADKLGNVTLRAAGGELPLRWLVNGIPVLSPPYKRQAVWQPDGSGAARITVMDRAGTASSVAVWLE